MANIKKKLEEVKSTVSNPEEATKVMAIIMEIVEDLEDKVNGVEKRQLALEEKTAEIYEMLTDMEEELISAMNEEFEAECPYCGETIPFKVPEGDEEEFECPKCHNMIELEMMFHDDECDCGHCHGDCDCDDCDDCDSDEDDEEEE